MLRVRPRIHHHRTRLNPLAVAALAALLFFTATPGSVANTVDAISWAHDSDGNTTISIVCTEPVDPSSFRTYPIPDPPRAVIVIEGITERIKPDVMTIEDRHVTRVRLGYPTDASPPFINIILDLASESAQILDVLHTGNTLVAVVGSPYEPRTARVSEPSAVLEPSPTPSPRLTATQPPPTPTVVPSLTATATATTSETATATATASETATVTVTPTATETASVTPTATATASETATETVAATATAIRTYPDRPAPPVLPTVRKTPTAAPSPSPIPTRSVMVFSSPTPGNEPEFANHVIDVVTNLRNDGSTLLRITADGRIPAGCARTLEITDEPPRIILSLRGLSAPDLPRTIEIGDPNLARIRLVHDAETSEGELHLVLQLERPGVSVIEFNQIGPHLAVQLAVVETPPVKSSSSVPN